MFKTQYRVVEEKYSNRSIFHIERFGMFWWTRGVVYDGDGGYYEKCCNSLEEAKEWIRKEQTPIEEPTKIIHNV